MSTEAVLVHPGFETLALCALAIVRGDGTNPMEQALFNMRAELRTRPLKPTERTVEDEWILMSNNIYALTSMHMVGFDHPAELEDMHVKYMSTLNL